MLPWTFTYKFLCGHIFFGSLGYTLWVGIWLYICKWDCWILWWLCLYSEVLPNFSQAAEPFYILSVWDECMNLSTSSPTFVIVYAVDYTHPSICEVVSHCCFDFHFPNNVWRWTSFHMLIGYLYIFSGEMSIQILCLFFNCFFFVFLLLSWKSSLYTLDSTPLPEIWFANIFSHFVGCLFTFLMSFVAQKLIILMRSKLSIFLIWLLMLYVPYLRDPYLT